MPFTLLGCDDLIDRAHQMGDADAEGLISLLTPSDEGLPDRQRLRHDAHGCTAGVMAATATSKSTGHVPVRPRCADRDDLRGRERCSGAGSWWGVRLAQRRRQARDGVLRDGQNLRLRENKGDEAAES